MQLDLRQFAIFVLCWCFVFCIDKTGCLQSAENNRFNVLFICVDDLRPDLGCYGNTLAQTPNMDKLARQAMVFERHYVQVPRCGASRYALLTGRSPAKFVSLRHEVFHVGKTQLRRRQQKSAQSLPELFRRSGYETTCIGKVSHTPDGRIFKYDGTGDGRQELVTAWENLDTPFGPWKRGWGAFFAYPGGQHREDGQGHKSLMDFSSEPDQKLPDELLADAAIKRLRLQKTSKSPFFLSVGFYKPHLPFVAPKEDWDAFETTNLELEPQQPLKLPRSYSSGELFKYDMPFEKKNPLDQDSVTQIRRAYFACVRYVDRQIGRVLDELRQLELDKSTIVVLWGDHGWCLGERRTWAKNNPLERSLWSPLMVRIPSKAVKPGRTEAIVETIDIFPTLLDLCKPNFKKTRWPLDGKSLVPVLIDPKQSVREAAVSYGVNSVTVRSKKYRLTEWTVKVKSETEGEPPKKVQRSRLFDLSNDIDNTDDVAADFPEVVERLRKFLPPK